MRYTAVLALQSVSLSMSNCLNLLALKIITEKLYKQFVIYIMAAIAGIAQLVEQLTCNQ